MYCFWLRKTQYLCGFPLDYYNATPTKNPADLILNVRLAGFFYVNTSIDFLVCVYYNYIKYMSPEAECRSIQLPD